jgi:hypothetical protein
MTRTAIHPKELELVALSRRFVAAAEEHAESRAMLERYGYTRLERARGVTLIDQAERAFAWEQQGLSWNFLSATAAERRREAGGWFVTARRRHVQRALRAAEGGGVVGVARSIARALSPTALAQDLDQLRRDLRRASCDRPADAPPPRDAVLVELQGWYERWRLLAQRLFRGRPDLLSPYGLVPGKAPPRLRGKLAREQYGEGAAGKLPA